MARSIIAAITTGPQKTWPELPRFVVKVNEPTGIANIPDKVYTGALPLSVTFDNVPPGVGYTVTVSSVGATGNTLAPDVTSAPFTVPQDFVVAGPAAITITIQPLAL